MPRVHFVKKARTAKPEHGIAKGDSYYNWGLMIGRRGVKFYSKTRPKPQQLTRSEYRIAVLDVLDRIAEESLSPDDIDDIISDIRQIAEDQDEKFNNLPDSLQNGSSGELLTERKDACEAWADELEAVEAPEEIDETDIDDDDLEEHGFDPADLEDDDGEVDEDALNEAREKAVAKYVEAKKQENLDEWREAIRNCSTPDA